MANHVRQQIREQVGTVLAGLTTTGARVYESRVYRMDTTNLPGLVIFTTRETSFRGDMDDTIERKLDLVVEGYAKPSADMDDVLDTIAKEVETAMAADVTFGGLSTDCHLIQTDSDLFGDADKAAGVVRLTFRVEYETLINAPDVAL